MTLFQILMRKFIDSAAAGNLAVGGGEQETVIARAIDRAAAFVLCFGAGNHQPLVSRAVEVKAGHAKLKLCFSRRHVGAFLILRDKPEVGAAGCDGQSAVLPRVSTAVTFKSWEGRPDHAEPGFHHAPTGNCYFPGGREAYGRVGGLRNP